MNTQKEKTNHRQETKDAFFTDTSKSPDTQTQKEKTKSQTKPRIECRSSAKLRNGVSDKTGTPQTEKEIIHIGNDNRCQTCFEAGKSEALSGEYCVKLIEQGKEIGKSETIKQVIKIIEEIEHKPSSNSITQYNPYVFSEQLKSKIGELAK